MIQRTKPLDDYNIIEQQTLDKVFKFVETKEFCNEGIVNIAKHEPDFIRNIENECISHFDHIIKNCSDEELEERVCVCLRKFAIIGLLIGRETFSYNPEEMLP